MSTRSRLPYRKLFDILIYRCHCCRSNIYLEGQEALRAEGKLFYQYINDFPPTLTCEECLDDLIRGDR